MKKENMTKRSGRSERDIKSADKGGILLQAIIISVIVILIVAIVLMVRKWNKGQESGYDPDEISTDFDTEPNDYILPLDAASVADKKSDGKLTILALGNSPFADEGKDNNLAKALSDIYDANVINCGFEGSYITCKNSEYSDDDPEDGVSLPYIADALATGNYAAVKKSAAAISENNAETADIFSHVDMTEVDCIAIMYDLEDYVDHRPLGSESVTDMTSIYGAVRGSIEKLRDAYPYVRIVFISQAAGGKTIDDFFVDGDIHDIGNGLLSDYVTFELEATASAGASFLDIYYGAINVDVRDKYLIDDYHINDDGAKVIAKYVYDRIKIEP